MRRLLLAVCALAFVGCDAVVSETPGPSRVEERAVSCTHTSFCFTCMPGFDGKVSCGMKFSAFCPGSKAARVNVTPVLRLYESGETMTYERTEVLETLEACR